MIRRGEIERYGVLWVYEIDTGEDPYMAQHLSDSTPGVEPTVEIKDAEIVNADEWESVSDCDPIRWAETSDDLREDILDREEL